MIPFSRFCVAATSDSPVYFQGVGSIERTGRATDRSLVSVVYNGQSMFVLRTCQDITNKADIVELLVCTTGTCKIFTNNNKYNSDQPVKCTSLVPFYQCGVIFLPVVKDKWETKMYFYSMHTTFHKHIVFTVGPNFSLVKGIAQCLIDTFARVSPWISSNCRTKPYEFHCSWKPVFHWRPLSYSRCNIVLKSLWFHCEFSRQ